MTKKLAKIKYLPNNFKSSKQVIMLKLVGKIELERLTYWSVEQGPYYSYLTFKKEKLNKK